MANKESGRHLRRMLAQDAKIVARADSYGPMPGQQIKERPPAPAPIKAQSPGLQAPTKRASNK
jgi:hypothetical protein